MLGPGKVLVVAVTGSGVVENRIIDMPLGLTPSALTEATNYLNAQLQGRSIAEARAEILRELEMRRAELDGLTQKVVEAGVVVWGGGNRNTPDTGFKHLIVRGRANLLDQVEEAAELERIRQLFDDLEARAGFLDLLDLAKEAEGVHIFIGSENKLFSLSGSAVIIAPYKDEQEKVIGAIGVIGPTRLNYGRIIPMVDYTARVVGRMLR